MGPRRSALLRLGLTISAWLGSLGPVQPAMHSTVVVAGITCTVRVNRALCQQVCMQRGFGSVTRCEIDLCQCFPRPVTTTSSHKIVSSARSLARVPSHAPTTTFKASLQPSSESSKTSLYSPAGISLSPTASSISMIDRSKATSNSSTVKPKTNSNPSTASSISLADGSLHPSVGSLVEASLHRLVGSSTPAGTSSLPSASTSSQPSTASPVTSTASDISLVHSTSQPTESSAQEANPYERMKTLACSTAFDVLYCEEQCQSVGALSGQCVSARCICTDHHPKHRLLGLQVYSNQIVRSHTILHTSAAAHP